MTTLAEMKATIASEIMRVDLDDAIAKEITKAIRFYRAKRFWFNEKRSTVLFNTVAGQDTYTSADSSYIPDLIRIDSVTVTKDDTAYLCTLIDQVKMELWLTSPSIAINPPIYYSYYEQKLRFYPKPDNAYPVRVAGVIRVPEPATDDEADNVWMTEAEELIRSRAKRNIFLHWMEDGEAAQRMQAAETEAFDRLQEEASSRTQVNCFDPSEY